MTAKYARLLWVAIDGSIYTQEEIPIILESGKKLFRRGSIAFNVGGALAAHIVQLHNDKLRKEKP